MSLILKIIIKFNTSHTDDKKLEEKMEKLRFLIPDLFIRNSFEWNAFLRRGCWWRHYV